MLRRLKKIVRWTRRTGGKRALWRLKYESNQRVESFFLGGHVWPQPARTYTRAVWAACGASTWPGAVAKRVRSGEAGRVLRALLDTSEQAQLAHRTCAMCERGAWRLYEALDVEVGAPVDWLKSPSHEASWPLLPTAKLWTRGGRRGDIKDVWEVGRCGWLADYIRQRALDGDEERWASSFASQVEGFERQHGGRALGPHFASGQECAIRAVRWCLAASVFIEDEGFEEQDAARVQRVLYAHGVWIARHLDFARHAVPNNHVIAETLALWMLGECFPWWEESASWLARARRVLHEEIVGQFSLDGGYCQASHTYHRAALEMLVWWWAMSERDAPTRALISQLLERSAAHLFDWMMDEQRGILPNFGANDGAHFHLFSSAGYEDFRPTLAMIHGIVTGGASGRFSGHAGSAEASYWVHGEEALCGEAWSEARASVMRGNDNSLIGLRVDGWQVGLRVGEVWGTASQVDMGHVELWRGEVCVACDRGSYRYHEEEVFEAYAGLEGHNVVRFEGEDFAVQRAGRFALSARGWRPRHGVSERVLWMTHEGWRAAVRGRSVREVRVEGGSVRVRDQMRMRKRCEGVVRWQCAGEVSYAGGSWLCKRGEVTVRVSVSVRGGEMKGAQVLATTRSRRYGEERAMSVLEVRFVAREGVMCEIVTEFEDVCISS